MTAQDTHMTVDAATEAVFEMAGGVWTFKTLAAAVELGLFGALAGGQKATKEELAAELGLPERPADLLLAACTSLGLLDKDGNHYRNSAVAEAVLVPDSPDYLGGAVTYTDTRNWRGWGRLTEALRTDRPTGWDPDAQGSPFAAEDQEMLGEFFGAIHNLGRATARAVADAYDFSGHDRLLDVGSGSGSFPIELCSAYPQLTATCYDLPHVVPLAQTEIDKAGMADRITTVAGDFFIDEALPGGHDVALLSAILHDWDEDTGRMLLAKCHDALPPGGVLLICEQLLDDDRTGPPRAALVGLNMLVATTGGRNYAEGEYRDWLLDVGFREVTRLPCNSPGTNGVLVARA